MNAQTLRVAGNVLIGVGIVLLAVGGLLLVSPKTYQATVRIHVEKDAPDVGSSLWRNSSAPFDPYWLQDQFETLQSYAILSQVITNLNLKKKWAAKFKEPGELSLSQTYHLLQNQVEARQDGSNSLIAVTVGSDDRIEAADIANEIARVYRDYRLSQRRAMTERGIQTLENELKKQEEQIQSTQATLESLRKELGLPDNESGSSPASEAEIEKLNDPKLQEYWKTRRALDSLKQARDRLQLRIIQEKVEQGIPRSSLVEIIDLAEPPSEPRFPSRMAVSGLLLGGVGAILLGTLLRLVSGRLKRLECGALAARAEGS